MWIAAPSSSVGTAGVADSKVAEKWGKCNNATPTNHCLTAAAAAVQPVQYSKCHHPTPVKRALNSHQDYQLWTILLTSELWAWCQAQPPSSSFSSPSPSTGKFMLLNHSSIFFTTGTGAKEELVDEDQSLLRRTKDWRKKRSLMIFSVRSSFYQISLIMSQNSNTMGGWGSISLSSFQVKRLTTQE